MKKPLSNAIKILTAGMLLPAHALAQQTPPPSTQGSPASSTQQAPAAKAQKAPAKKPGQAPASKAPAVLVLNTQKDKTSYAIGMNVGKGLHRDSVDIDPAILLRGLKDALAGGKTLLTDQEAQATLTALQNDLRKKQQEMRQQIGRASCRERV